VPAGTPPAAALTAAKTGIAVDADAFDAVFASDSAPLKPTAEHLMWLDKLSPVAGETALVDRQQKFLARSRPG